MSRRGLSRRSVLAASVLALTGAGAVEACAVLRLTDEDRAPAAGRPTQSPTPSPTPDYLAAARTKVATYVEKVGKGHVTLAIKDRGSDLGLSIGTTSFQTASIVKVDILAALLLRARQRDEEITESDRRKAKKMITLSDNDAATALFQKIGGTAGLNTANRTFGLKQTKPVSSWGMSKTTAADQIRLLSAITDEDGRLGDEDRSYLFGLMSEVDATQNWGVPAAALPAATGVYVKNGWDNISADGGLWQVNSIGRLTEPGHDWLVAVLSNHHKTHPAGVRVVEAIAKYALTELRKIPTV
jgi:hypothetical protein